MRIMALGRLRPLVPARGLAKLLGLGVFDPLRHMGVSHGPSSSSVRLLVKLAS